MYAFANMPQDNPGKFMLFVILVALWELFWKGKALWHTAQKKEKNWFIAILLLNTLGILPIIYLQFFANQNSKKK